MNDVDIVERQNSPELRMISDEEIVRLVNIIGPVVKEMDSDWRDREGGPTEFEIVTAMMFVYFAEGHVDYAVIEVGIGGLFDSTNVITPLMSVITTVAMDHAHILGDTIAKIATHKAGIIKYKKPILIGKLPDEAIKEEWKYSMLLSGIYNGQTDEEKQAIENKIIEIASEIAIINNGRIGLL